MQPRTILALDTSTLVASVAVVVRDADGLRVATSRDSDVKNHSDQLVTLIDDVLARAGLTLRQLDGVAVGAGPGSFTGLRIGMSTAKGLCFAAGLPLWSISSLAALAWDARDAGSPVVAPVLDARRGEVFYAVYDVGGRAPRMLVDERVAAPEAAAAQIREAASQSSVSPTLVGDGATLYADVLTGGAAGRSCRATPSAASVGLIACDREPVSSLATAVPVYIRPSEAERKYPAGNPGGAFAKAPAPE